MNKINSLLWLRICVFIDFFSVALIVPLLSTYFRSAGITIELHSLIMSLYYLSQIFGGILMGILSDIYSKRNILIISFLGSAISYGLVGLTKNLYLLFLSRVIVGIVKQTFTISSTIISSNCSNSVQRAELLSHLNAATSLAFIIGPSIGGLLYKLGPQYPALVSSLLFILNTIICIFTIPLDSIQSSSSSPSSSSLETTITTTNEKQITKNSKEIIKSKINSLVQYLYELSTFLLKHNLFIPLLCPILLLFLDKISSPASLPSYYELRYQVEVSSLGYIYSITSMINFICHSFMMKPTLYLTSNSLTFTILIVLSFTLIANFLESFYCSNITDYVIFYLPFSIYSTSIHHPLSKTLLMNSISSQYTGSLLGIMNILENIVNVLSPVYSSIIYKHIGYEKRGFITMTHYFFAIIFLGILFHKYPQENQKINKQKNDKNNNSSVNENQTISNENEVLIKKKNE